MNARYCVCGARGIFALSSDGVSWELHETGKIQSNWVPDLFCVIRGPDRFVIVGDYGVSVVIIDGQEPTVHESDNAILSRAGCYSLGYYWRSTTRSTLFRSSDGAVWTEMSTAVQVGTPNALAGNTSVMCIGGIYGFFALTTDSGASWKSVSVGETDDVLFAYIDGERIYAAEANGTCISYLDPPYTAWVSHANNVEELSQVYSTVRPAFSPTCGLIASKSGSYLNRTQDNGASWNPTPTNSLASALRSSMAYDGSRFIAVGTQGEIVSITSDGSTLELLAQLQQDSGYIPALYGVGAYVPSVAAPIITPSVENHDAAFTVEMSCSTSGARIYYTLDGNTPTTSSVEYTAPFTLSTSCVVKAIAVHNGSSSTVSIKSYTVTLLVIYYTLDGSTPTRDSTMYTGSFRLTQSCVVKAIAVRDGFFASDVMEKAYLIMSPNEQTSRLRILDFAFGVGV